MASGMGVSEHRGAGSRRKIPDTADVVVVMVRQNDRSDRPAREGREQSVSGRGRHACGVHHDHGRRAEQPAVRGLRRRERGAGNSDPRDAFGIGDGLDGQRAQPNRQTR